MTWHDRAGQIRVWMAMGGCCLLFSINCKSVCGGTKRKCSIRSFMYSLRNSSHYFSLLHPDSDSPVWTRAHAYMLKSLTWLSHCSLQNLQKLYIKKWQIRSYYIADLVYLSKLQVDSVQSSNAWVTNSWPNSIGKSKDYRKTTAFFEVLCLVCMCNSCSSSSGSTWRIQQQRNRRESWKQSDTDTGTVQFQAYIHIHAIMSCPLFSVCSSSLCCTTCLSGTWFSCFVSSLHMHAPFKLGLLIKQHSEYIQCGAPVLRCPRTVLVLG